MKEWQQDLFNSSPFLIIHCLHSAKKKKVHFSITTGNVELIHQCSPNTLAWEQQVRNKIKKQTKEARREARVRKKAKRARKKEVPTSHPNHNTILVNKIQDCSIHLRMKKNLLRRFQKHVHFLYIIQIFIQHVQIYR